MNISNSGPLSREGSEERKRSQGQRWIGWVPLILLPASAFGLRDIVPAWGFMWILAFSVFAALKWLTWWKVRRTVRHPAWRSGAYLLVWPGMDAESFLDPALPAHPNSSRAWLWAALNTVFGGSCIWLVARAVPASLPLLRGWVGMLGLILLLHFGSFRILALTWQSFGVAAAPIMNAPLRSTSLSEFWGQRWNLGFRQLAHGLIFRPLYKRLRTQVAGFLVFVASGLLHDLVISVPARGGYGLPTLYFALQGIGVAVERSGIGKRFGLGHAARGWFFMAVITAAPAFWLFHPIFVRNVILPFMQAIGAL
jgi:membrane bound O-acyltransferase family protein